MDNKKIAIIGTGISGLSCGYHLSLKHDLTLFEEQDYTGGHTHTVSVEKNGEQADIDTGFIVFNDRTYPRFMKLMDELGVGYQPTEMSFSARNDQEDLEYNGSDAATLFAQKKNIIRPTFWKMLYDIYRFNNDVRQYLEQESQLTIGDYLAMKKYSPMFVNNYLLPMISAIWSMGLDSCKDFPLQFFVKFFINHGLLDVVNRPQWYTIQGGSSRYIEPLTKNFKERIRHEEPVRTVYRHEDSIEVRTAKGVYHFDEVIFACHGDQSFKLLGNPTEKEKDILSAFTCSENSVILHTDTRYLPRREKAWASWNYLVEDSAKEQVVLTYNMNILQRLTARNTYLVTLNADIDEEYILQRFSYSHPVYTIAAIEAQRRWGEISGKDRIHFCGAYWFNGFHEDGVRSGERVCAMMGENQ